MKSVSILAVVFFVFVFLFLALPQNSYSGIAMSPLGCCVDNNNVCIGCGELESCSTQESLCAEINGNFIEEQTCFEGDPDGCAGPDSLPGCCVFVREGCVEGIEIGECINEAGIIWALETSCSEVPQCQQATTGVPSLSQWGLIVVVALLGIVGLIGVLNRKASA